MGNVSSPTFFTSPRKGFSVTYSNLSTEFYHAASVWDDTDNVSVPPDEIDANTAGLVIFYFDWQAGHRYHGILNFSSPSHGPFGTAPSRVVAAAPKGKGPAAGANGDSQDGEAVSKKKGKSGRAPEVKP